MIRSKTNGAVLIVLITFALFIYSDYDNLVGTGTITGNVVADWTTIDSIYYDVGEDEPLFYFGQQAVDELKLHLEQVSGKTYTVLTNPAPNLAFSKTVTTSSTDVTGDLSSLTDGVTDYRPTVSLGEGPQWVQVDLGEAVDIGRVNVIHTTGNPTRLLDERRYHDVIVQLSIDGVAWQTIYNNDQDNSAGQGVGTDSEAASTSVTDADSDTAKWKRV